MTADSARAQSSPLTDPRPGLHGWQAILATVAAATAVDLSLLGAGHAADASFVLDDRGSPHVVTIAGPGGRLLQPAHPVRVAPRRRARSG